MDLSLLDDLPIGQPSGSGKRDLSALDNLPIGAAPQSPQALGYDARPRADMGEAFQAGALQYQANLQYMQGMFKDMLGGDPTEDIEQARGLMMRSQEVDAGSLRFSDVLEGDSFSSWLGTTLAGLGPDILGTLSTTAAGAAVGFALGGPGGAFAGGVEAATWRTAAQAGLRKSLREAIEATAQGTATAEQRRAATNAMRANLANRYATYGAVGANAPQGWGEAYGESVEAGNPNAGGAFAVGTAMTGLDVLPVKFSIDAVTDLLKAEGKTGGVMTEAAKAWGAATLGDGVSELGQEELLIQFRDALVPEQYAGSQEAWDRRLEAGAAGAAAGGTRGLLVDAPARAAQVMPRPQWRPGQDGAGGEAGGPAGPTGPSYRDRMSEFAARFDPETDERGFVRSRQEYGEGDLRQGFEGYDQPDPAARQDFTPPPAPGQQGDPAARQDFTPPPAPGPQADPAARQDFTAQPAPGQQGDPAARQDFTPPPPPRADLNDPAARQDFRDIVSTELRQRLRERGYTPRDMAKMTGGLAQAVADNDVPVERFRIEMDRMQRGGTVSESQADVDAQFNSMLDPDSPKRAMEITHGSPTPRGLESRSDVIQVPTENGTLLTTDRAIAREVELTNGDMDTMAKVLGYGKSSARIRPDRAEVAIVRDSNGAIVHSEAADSNQRRATNRRLRKLRPVGGSIEYQNVQQQLAERMARRDDPAPGQQFAVDGQPRDMRRSDDDLRRGEAYPSEQGLEQRFEQEDADLARRVAPEDDVTETVAALHRQLQEVEQRIANGEVSRGLYLQRDALQQQLEQLDTPEMREIMGEQQADEAGADAPVRVFQHGGNTRRIRRDGMAETVEGEVFGTRQEIPRRGRQQVQNQDRMAQPQVDEIDGVEAGAMGAEEVMTGYQTRGDTDDAPTTIGVRVTPEQLDDANIVYRDRGREKGRTSQDRQATQARVQHLAPKKIGPRTETATLPTESGDITVPATLARDLRKYRRDFPQDTWEVATRDDGEGNTEFMIVRRRDPETASYKDRRTRERVTNTDDTVQMGEGSMTVTQRIMQGLERARWRGRKGEPPKGSEYRKMRLRDEKDGTIIWVNPNPLKIAGADVNRGDSNDPMRQARGLATALAILDTMGFRLAQWAPDAAPQLGDGARHRESFRAFGDVYGLPYNTLGPKVVDIEVDPELSTLPPETQASLRKLWMNAPRSFSPRNAQSLMRKFQQAKDLNKYPGRKREADFLAAVQELRDQGYEIPSFYDMIKARELQLPDALTEGVNLMLAGDRAWPTNTARDMWETMSEAERRDIVEQEGMDPESTENALDEQPNGVVEAMNRLADDDVFVPAGDLAGNPDRRWEGAPRYFDEVPDTTDRVDLLNPNRTRPGVIPDIGHGARVHPLFGDRDGTKQQEIERLQTQLRDDDTARREAPRVRRVRDEVRRDPDWTPEESLVDWRNATPPEPLSQADRQRIESRIAQLRAEIALGEVVRGVATTAKRIIGGKRNTIVVPWTNNQFTLEDVLASLPEADYRKLNSNLQQRTDLEAMLRGRAGTYATTMHIGGSSIVVLDPSLSPEMASIAMAHEMGHIAYKDHLGNLLLDKKRFDKLYAQFQKDREAGLVKQYMGDERMAFEEWMSDRFASWLHRRSRPNQAGVAQAGAFAALRDKLRGIFDGARKLIAKLKRQGDVEIPERMKANRSADAFYDKMANLEALRSRVHDLRGRARTGRQRFDPDLHAELDALSSQLAKAERDRDSSLKVEDVQRIKARLNELRQRLGEQTRGASGEGMEAVQRLRRSLRELGEADFTSPESVATRDFLIRDLQRQLAEAQQTVRPLGRETLAAELDAIQAQVRDLQAAMPRTGDPVPLSELVQAMDRARAGKLRRDAQTAARAAQQAQQRREAEGREAAGQIRQQAEGIRQQRIQHWTADPVLPEMLGATEQQAADLTYLITGGEPPQGPPGGQPPVPAGADGPRRNPLAEAIGRHIDRYAASESGAQAAQFAASNLGRALSEGGKYWRSLANTVDARLRPISEQLAQMIWSGPNTRSRLWGGRGYLNRVESESAHWAGKLTRALPEDKARADQVMRMVQREIPRDQLPEDARPLFDFMQELGEYLEENVEGFRARQVYGTRVYNVSEIISRPAAFDQLLVDKIEGMTLADAAGIRSTITLDDSAVALETLDQMGAGPGLSADNARLLNEISNADLQTAGFLEAPRDSFFKHVRAAVHRAEFEAVFGGQRTASQMLDDIQFRRSRGQNIPEQVDAGIREARDEALAEGQPEPTFYDPAAKAKQLMEGLSPEQRTEAFDMFEAVMGRANRAFGHQIHPKVARFQSMGVAYIWLTTLGMAAISQITDLMTIAMRYRSMKGIGEMVRILGTMSAAERRAFAETVATVQKDATMDAISATYGGDFMTPGARKVTDTFFKVTGLEAITNFNRGLATQMGVQFLKKELQGAMSGDRTSIRRLNDLGLDANDVATFFNINGGRLVGENGTKIRQALFDYVDESMLRPHAAMRPEWASNPWYQLLWVLKPFMWGGKKIFIDGAYREFQQMRREGRSVAESSAAFMMIPMMGLPLALLSVAMKDMAKETLNTLADDDEYEWMLTNTNWASIDGVGDLLDRTGAMGPMSLAWGMFEGMEFGTPPAISLAGPAAERAFRITQGQGERVLGDSVPIAGLIY